MTTYRPRVTGKAAYVKSQPGDGKHHCHWPGCDRTVPPAMWGCKQHWFQLPQPLRDRIWRTYKPGQEISKTPSTDYIAAARAVQEWILKHATPAEREICRNQELF